MNEQTQCSAAFFTVLREFNDNAAETTLMRWMVMLGVVLRRPPTVLNVTGLARETVKFVSDIIIDAMFKGLALEQILRNEAKALSFQKNWKLDFRKTVNTVLFFGSVATGVANAVKIYGTWRNGYATGLGVDNKTVNFANVATRRISYMVAGLYAALALIDLFDGIENYNKHRPLSYSQLASSAIGITGATVTAYSSLVGSNYMIGWLSLSQLALYLIIAGIAIGFITSKIQGDNVAQWLDRCYWGIHPDYPDPHSQKIDFEKLIQGA
ncbi:hypothetical protein WT81_17325 [Burkholderia stagnalis]|uniref:hypothetical protein n=1 Tax=Burkholderia stagnalis TaxID=1503054 RepID=UPI00075FFBAC|nr:hypothetical protein [Burkholderia stagnalis]KWK41707.1 hypothetical protein WT80_24930 [Burkholderia stagnalis]KWK58310.1 hypothetical protein WT81_17325 [Burkholderia stagnalis]KWN70430.1 hypothetical protein WT90_21005 [Burkholderia stagnalis]